MIRVLLAVCIVLMISISVLFFYAKHQAIAKASLEDEKKALVEAMVIQTDQLNKQVEVLKDRERRRVLADRRASEWEQRWRSTQNEDEMCGEWSGYTLPDCVVAVLREASSSNDKTSDSRTSSRTD